jgi:hypothetical protein
MITAPSNLTSVIISSSQIKLEWQNNDVYASGCLIEKKIGSGSWIQIDESIGASSYIDENADCNIVNAYRIRAVNNLITTVYLQDLFDDADYTLMDAHTPDINRTGNFYVTEGSGNHWEIFQNYLHCIQNPEELSINLGVNNYKVKVTTTVASGYLYNCKFRINETFNFRLIDHTIGLYNGDTLLIEDDTWNPGYGDEDAINDIEIEVGALFVKIIAGNCTLQYDTATTKDSVFGITDAASSDTLFSNLIIYMDQSYSTYSNETSITILTLTIQEIWERYSEIKYERDIYIKRINSEGVYEIQWNNINDLIPFESRMRDVCGSIQYSLPNNTYSLGAVIIDNASFLFLNQFDQLSNEEVSNSIFYDYVRHQSMIKIVDTFIDSYSYPGSFGKISNITFEGFIDDRLCVTNTNDTENIIATDVMGTLMKSMTIAELGLTNNQTIQNLVYQILNRAEFSNFFTISLININPGFNSTNIDLTKYDQSTTVLSLLQDLSIGHSIFYVRNGIFYYKANTPTTPIILSLGEIPQRKIQFNKYCSGGNTVFDKLFWQDSTETYISPERTYNQTYTFSIKGINDTSQRQGLLDYAGPSLCQRKSNFDLTIPFLPTLFLLDRLSILHRGVLQKDCFILDLSRLDEGRFLEPVGAFTIEATDNWKIIKLVHSGSQTIISLEKIT